MERGTKLRLFTYTIVLQKYTSQWIDQMHLEMFQIFIPCLKISVPHRSPLLTPIRIDWHHRRL